MQFTHGRAAHTVHFYDSEPLLAASLSEYLSEGSDRERGLLVIAAGERPRALEGLLAGMDTAERAGRLVFLDAREMLGRFMRNGQPDWGRFEEAVGGALRQLQARVGRKRIRAYGEMVGILWQRGERAAAVAVEEFWNRLIRTHGLELLCAYPIDVFAGDFRASALDGVLCSHSHVLDHATSRDLEAAVKTAMDEVLGPKAEGLRLLMQAHFRPAWAAMPQSYAHILWLRDNLGEYAGEVLARARRYYQPGPNGNGRS